MLRVVLYIVGHVIVGWIDVAIISIFIISTVTISNISIFLMTIISTVIIFIISNISIFSTIQSQYINGVGTNKKEFTRRNAVDTAIIGGHVEFLNVGIDTNDQVDFRTPRKGNGIASYPRKSVENHEIGLIQCHFFGNVVGNGFGRDGIPGLWVHLNAVGKATKEAMPLGPVFVWRWINDGRRGMSGMNGMSVASAKRKKKKKKEETICG